MVSGPSFAREVALNLPTALTVASSDTTVAERIAQWLRNERVRVYTSTDVTRRAARRRHQECHRHRRRHFRWARLSAPTRARRLSRAGLRNLRAWGSALGGRAETFTGLTGAGDLILTCTDNASRNRRLGLALGQGGRLSGILRDIGQEVEGVATAREVYALAKARQVELPITEQVYRVLYENLSPQAAVEALLRREPRPE